MGEWVSDEGWNNLFFIFEQVLARTLVGSDFGCT